MITVNKLATVRELPSGWLWKERGNVYKTASAVLKAFRKEDSTAATGSKVCVIRITNWEPTTIAGTMILRAITTIKGESK
jgi:hypothetical protein